MARRQHMTRDQYERARELIRDGIYVIIDTDDEEVQLRYDFEEIASYDGITKANINRAITAGEQIRERRT